jgi:HD domain-containing protein/fibronectin type III domain protein
MAKIDTTETDDNRGDRWRGRPLLSFLVSGSVFVTPIALSIVVATITAHVLPRPRGTGALAVWWLLVLAVPTVVLIAADRLARRALPLAVLLKMTMVFPDRAPKRVAVARRSGNTRDLARRVEEARTLGVADEPVVAAERILALAGALNAHDRLTRGHGERVRTFTDLIADELDLPAEDRDRLRWSALLHDIGKLAVHPEILNKPSKLDDAEWEVIKSHPLEGAKLTAPLAHWLGPWANTIAEHHEKYDGTGYPYGLKGEEISLGGRIVAVADCYDTMTTVRSYKSSMSPKVARAELAACAGTHFDPKIVRAFLDVSIGRVRPVAGPLAWLGSLPFVSSIPQAVSVIGRVGAASVAVTGAVTVGSLNVTPHRATAPDTTQTAAPSPPVPLPAGVAGGASPAAPSAITATNPLDGGHQLGGTSTTTTVGGSGGGGPSGPSVTVPTLTAPAAPGSAGAVAGDGQVTVSWSAPADGGSPITAYAVTPAVGLTAQGARSVGPSSTSVVMTGLSNGTQYTFTVVAINAVGSSPPSIPSPAVTPLAAVLSLVNGGKHTGRAQAGDQIVVTFSPVPAAAALCTAWSTASAPDLDDDGVVVTGTEPSSGDDTITMTDSVDCSGGFHFGTIDLGQRGYFSGSATFGGNISGCRNAKTTDCSTVHWDGHDTLTITLGKASAVEPSQSAPSVAVYTPDPALELPGPISSAASGNF